MMRCLQWMACESKWIVLCSMQRINTVAFSVRTLGVAFGVPLGIARARGALAGSRGAHWMAGAMNRARQLRPETQFEYQP